MLRYTNINVYPAAHGIALSQTCDKSDLCEINVEKLRSPEHFNWVLMSANKKPNYLKTNRL